MKKSIQFEFDILESIDKLNPEDKKLLEAAREITTKAYAPYSRFQVGAVAMLNNGETVSGANQENASFPVGICAERTLLSTAAMIFTDVPISTMAIAYHNLNAESKVPVSPCGMCRQALHEYEERTKQSIRIILSGMEGEVYIIEKSSHLLPLSFSGDVLI